MYKVPEEWKLSDFLELSNDEKLKWLYNGVKNGGGSNLPEVTSDDNGDVLTVVEGAWAKAAPSGGSGVFEISFNVEWSDEQQTDIVTCNKAYAEILAAKQAGDYIVANAIFYNDVRTKDCANLVISPEMTAFMFIGVSTNNNQLLVASIAYNDYANGWMLETTTYYDLTPST